MKILAQNKSAYHAYEVLEKFDAGLVLVGHEVKAIREGNVSFEGSFIKIVGGKPTLLNLHIGRYSRQSSLTEVDEKRTRELLLKAYETERIEAKSTQKGFSLVPLKLYSDHGLIKLEFGIVKGKKKKAIKGVLKERQQKIDLQREAKTWG